MLKTRFWKKVERRGPSDCWPWLASVDRKGYGQINAGGATGRPLRAHRVAWELANGAIPDGLLVCHHCDNPSCVNPAHLFLGSAADNTRDMLSKGRPHGPKNPRHGVGIPWANLREKDVLTIRRALAAGEPTTRLAKAYHVAQSTIWGIKAGRIWRHSKTLAAGLEAAIA